MTLDVIRVERTYLSYVEFFNWVMGAVSGSTYPEPGQFFIIVSLAMHSHSKLSVIPFNIAYLQARTCAEWTDPVARYVVRDTGERIDLRYNKRADTFLQYGWIVERHLRDGE